MVSPCRDSRSRPLAIMYLFGRGQLSSGAYLAGSGWRYVGIREVAFRRGIGSGTRDDSGDGSALFTISQVYGNVCTCGSVSLVATPLLKLSFPFRFK